MIESVIVKYTNFIENIKGEVKDLLIRYDKEFIPPLSSRVSTTQTKNLEGHSETVKGITEYYNAVLEQEFIIAEKTGELIGFLTFRHNYASKYLKNFSPSNYVTTVIVRREYRGKGIATNMYHELLYNLPLRLKLSYVTTRTWSTNVYHNRLLEKLGFKKLSIIKDHRGRGIHTIYYGIKISSKS